MFPHWMENNRPWLYVETKPNGEEIMFCDLYIKAGISSDKLLSSKDVQILS